MIYVALLRGVNVGGHSRVEMPRLKALFESLSLASVSTYINTGNVIFSTDRRDEQMLCDEIESAIQREFGFSVPVVLRNQDQIDTVCRNLPASWQNNSEMKCDVLFLWQPVDDAATLEQLAIKPEIEDVVYIPGAILWRVDRQNIGRSGLQKIVGTALYKQITVRNCNTVRKLAELMGSV